MHSSACVLPRHNGDPFSWARRANRERHDGLAAAQTQSRVLAPIHAVDRERRALERELIAQGEAALKIIEARHADAVLRSGADVGDVELRPAADGGLEAVLRFTHATRAVRS